MGLGLADRVRTEVEDGSRQYGARVALGDPFDQVIKGADAAASKVVKANIEGMARWASRR